MKAWELVARGWCKWELAKNSDGIAVTVEDKNACYFCALGAIMRAYDEPSLTCALALPSVIRLVQDVDLKMHLSGKSALQVIGHWNDREATQEEVVRRLKKLDI